MRGWRCYPRTPRYIPRSPRVTQEGARSHPAIAVFSQSSGTSYQSQFPVRVSVLRRELIDGSDTDDSRRRPGCSKLLLGTRDRWLTADSSQTIRFPVSAAMHNARRDKFAPGVVRQPSIPLGVAVEAPLEIRRRVLRHVRIVQLLDRDREARVRAVDARAPVRRVRARGEHRLRPRPYWRMRRRMSPTRCAVRNSQ